MKDTWFKVAELPEDKYLIQFNDDMKTRVELTKDEMGNMLDTLVEFMKVRDACQLDTREVNLSAERKTYFANEIKSIRAGQGLRIVNDPDGHITIDVSDSVLLHTLVFGADTYIQPKRRDMPPFGQ